MNSDKLMKLMQIIDDNKETLKDGTYLDACNLLKDIKNDKDKDFEGIGISEERLYRVLIFGFEPLVVVNHTETCTPRCRKHKPSIVLNPITINTYMAGEDIREAEVDIKYQGFYDSSKSTSLHDLLNAIPRNDAPHAKIKEKSYVITNIQIVG